MLLGDLLKVTSNKMSNKKEAFMGVKVREKKLSDGRKSLYLDIYHNGHRQYEFLEIYLTTDRQQNKESKLLAENIRAKRQLEMQNTDHGFTPQFKKKVDFVKYFETSYQEKAKTGVIRDIQNYTGTLLHLKGYTGGSVQIGSIDRKWVEGFKAYLLSKGMKQSSGNNYLNRLRAVLRIAGKEGFTQANATDLVKGFAVTEVEKNFLSADEVAKLAATPNPNHPDVKRAFLFACFTGLRYSDLQALTWGDVKEGKIHFRQKKTEGFEYIPLNQTALQILAQCRGVNEVPFSEKLIFDLPGKGHLSKCVLPWVKAAGITKHITFHCSRHTFATSLLTAGADLYTTSKLLGHKSISSTAIYAKIVDEVKKNAVDALGAVEVV
jgi:integrase